MTKHACLDLWVDFIRSQEITLNFAGAFVVSSYKMLLGICKIIKRLEKELEKNLSFINTSED